MISIVPAIDIIDGKCVRLSQGDYAQKKIYNEHPLEVAKMFEGIGIQRLHLVDLDGAKKGSVVNLPVLQEIASKTTLVVDFGGGIKTDDDIRKVIDNGAKMITIGSIAVSKPELVLKWIQNYGAEKIIVGADSKNRQIAVSGWLETTALDLFDFITQYLSKGAIRFLCTDISKDGMMQGTAMDLYKELNDKIPQAKIIASGGITHLSEIEILNNMGVDSVIIGKAFYEGLITLDDLARIILKKT